MPHPYTIGKFVVSDQLAKNIALPLESEIISSNVFDFELPNKK